MGGGAGEEKKRKIGFPGKYYSMKRKHIFDVLMQGTGSPWGGGGCFLAISFIYVNIKFSAARPIFFLGKKKKMENSLCSKPPANSRPDRKSSNTPSSGVNRGGFDKLSGNHRD